MGSTGSKTETRPSKSELRRLVRDTTYDEQTIVAWYQVFTRYSGGRNVIRVEDLLSMCSKYERRQMPSEERLGRLFSHGESREVTFTDFLTSQYVASHGSQTDKLTRLFRLCDADGDGLISLKDLNDTFSSWGEHTDERVKQQLFTVSSNSVSEFEFITKCQRLISNKDS